MAKSATAHAFIQKGVVPKHSASKPPAAYLHSHLKYPHKALLWHKTLRILLVISVYVTSGTSADTPATALTICTLSYPDLLDIHSRGADPVHDGSNPDVLPSER